MNHIARPFTYERCDLDEARQAFLRAVADGLRAGVPVQEMSEEVESALSAARQLLALGIGK